MPRRPKCEWAFVLLTLNPTGETWWASRVATWPTHPSINADLGMQLVGACKRHVEYTTCGIVRLPLAGSLNKGTCDKLSRLGNVLRDLAISVDRSLYMVHRLTVPNRLPGFQRPASFANALAHLSLLDLQSGSLWAHAAIALLAFGGALALQLKVPSEAKSLRCKASSEAS